MIEIVSEETVTVTVSGNVKEIVTETEIVTARKSVEDTEAGHARKNEIGTVIATVTVIVIVTGKRIGGNFFIYILCINQAYSFSSTAWVQFPIRTPVFSDFFSSQIFYH